MVIGMTEDDNERSPGISEGDRQRIQAAALSGRPGDLIPEDSPAGPGRSRSETTEKAKSGIGPDADAPTPTRERVLNTGEYERLLIGASRLGGDEGLEAWSAFVVMGRLGLRAGELTHFDASWVDVRQRILKIPAREPCTNGRNNGICGSCKQAIRQRQQNGDDREFETIAAEYWQPKTQAAVRDIPFEWSGRVQEAISMLIDLHGGWPYSQSTLQRRMTDALDAAPGIGEDITSLHGLRGTAASYHAGNGVQKEALKQMMGWRSDRTPAKYLRIDGQQTRRALAEVYG